MPEGPMRWLKERIKFVKNLLAALDERLRRSRHAQSEVLRQTWQRARTASAGLWARLRNWHSGEVYGGPPDRGVLVMGIRRPWLATKFDVVRRKVPELGGKVLIGVLVTVVTTWIVTTWIAPG